MPMTAMPMCAEQYSPARGSGRTVTDVELAQEVPLHVGEEHLPGLVRPPAGFHGRGLYVVIVGQPVPKDSSTQFTVSASLSNITEWKKSTAPGNCPVPPELTSSSPIDIGFSVVGSPSSSISHTWPCSAHAPPATRCSTWTTMSWHATAAGSKAGEHKPFSHHSCLPSGSPG